MRHALVAAILLVSSSAVANPKAIEKVVKTSIVQLAALDDNEALGFARDALVYSTRGTVIENREDGCVSGAIANAFYGCLMATISHKPGTIVAASDGANVGWFQAPFTAAISADDPDGGPEKLHKESVRVGGIVVGSGTSWQIVAAMYTRPVSDKVLLAGSGGTPATGAPKLTGDRKLAEVVAGWFTSGFAPAAAKKGTLIASGTSPTEFKTGAGAVALARGWDKLKLGATEIDARLYAKGKIAFIHAVVKLPRMHGKGAVQMQLAVVAVPDGTGWRWVSLMYQPDEPIGV